VQDAGGRVVASYGQIGVLVARSANPAFSTAVQGSGVESVASTKGLGTRIEQEETLAEIAPGVPGDPTQEPLFASQWSLDQIDVPEAHAITTGSPDVVVGVLDSGISSSHPDLATQIDRSKSVSCLGGVQDRSEKAWNPSTSDHGTHVAGTIAAALNGVGVAGVAPGAKVASVKVVSDEGFIFPEAAVCGFLWAADQGMQITNNSYYIDPWELNCRNDARQRPVWQAVQRAIRYSQSKGVLNFASAGNSNYDLQHQVHDDGSPNDGSAPVEDRTVTSACLVLPGEAPGVVTVSSVGREERKSFFSSYGQGVVDVTAPGGDTRQPDPTTSDRTGAILSTTWTAAGGNGWGYKQGTSMSSPHAAGVAALALSAHPRLTAGSLASLLERTATALACPEGVYDPFPQFPQYQSTCAGGDARNSFYGAGNVNAFAAVR
jgi:subtilisin family serine protease